MKSLGVTNLLFAVNLAHNSNTAVSEGLSLEEDARELGLRGKQPSQHQIRIGSAYVLARAIIRAA
jgi:hypothetical protein